MNMPSPLHQGKKRFSYADYLEWSEEERWELIAGVPYLMTPAPSRLHQMVSGELFGQFWTYLRDKECEIYAAPFDVRIPEGSTNDEEILTVVQPDLAIICDHHKLDERGCLGAPDLFIVILSPHTAKKDLNEKFNLYERTGVKEYWAVFPAEKVIDVYRLNDDQLFARAGTYSQEEKVPVGLFLTWRLT